MSETDKKYMNMALKLARRGIGSIEPNPAVGCVIVKKGQIIGRGWHKKFGGPHAEINALEDCKTIGITPDEATMYVTLEPCCHQDKTPPCTDAIIAAKIERVVVAMEDPSEHNNGRGIERLRGEKIKVEVGLCENEAKLLNMPFIKFATTGKCWTILKWAQSIDGKMAWTSPSESQRWISGEQSRKDAQKLRRRVGAVLVGIGTVLADNPKLMARPATGKQPVRIVLDNNLKILFGTKLMSSADKSPVLVYASQQSVEADPQKAEKITQKGAELLAFPDTQGRSNLHFLLEELSKRSVTPLLVEGGPKVIASFLKERLADQVIIYITPKILAGAGSAYIAEPLAELAESFDLQHVELNSIGEDIRLTGLSKRALKDCGVQI